jgi:hypothetical protein
MQRVNNMRHGNHRRQRRRTVAGIDSGHAKIVRGKALRD